MGDEKVRGGAQQRAVLKRLQDDGVVDFDKLADIVREVSPQLFDPGTIADDYVVKGYSSVLQIWKVGLEDVGLEQISRIRDLGETVRKNPER